MKKNIKNLFGLGLAMAMTVSAASSSFAGTESFKVSGEITEIKINITIPTDGQMTINPYGAKQITSSPAFFENKEIEDNTSTTDYDESEDNCNYKVGLVGYTVTAVSVDENNLITLKTEDTAVNAYTGSKKEACIALNLGTAVTAAADANESADDKKSAYDTSMATTSKVIAGKKSETDYNKDDSASTYTKLLTPTEVDVATGKRVAFGITGTMNPSAEWEVGDKIVVTPVFQVTPTVAASSNP